MGSIRSTSLDKIRQDFSTIGWYPRSQDIHSTVARINFDLGLEAEIPPLGEPELLGILQSGFQPGSILQVSIGSLKTDGLAFASSHDLETVLGYSDRNLFNNIDILRNIPKSNPIQGRLVISMYRFIVMGEFVIREYPYALFDHVGFREISPALAGNPTGAIATLFTAAEPDTAGRYPLVFTIAEESDGGSRDRISSAWKYFAEQIAPADYEKWVRSY